MGSVVRRFILKVYVYTRRLATYAATISRPLPVDLNVAGQTAVRAVAPIAAGRADALRGVCPALLSATFGRDTGPLTGVLHAVLVILVAMSLSASFGVYAAHAQNDDTELHDTVRTAILSDPRSQTMTPEEIEAIASALTRQAQSVGMTAQDIVWRPTGDSAAQPQTSECSGFLCALNRAFGFDGSNYTIPIWLGAISLMLIFIIATIFEYRHLHKKKMQGEAPPAASMPPQQPLQ